MKPKDELAPELPQDDGPEDEEKQRGLHWSDVVDAATDLIDVVVDWFD